MSAFSGPVCRFRFRAKKNLCQNLQVNLILKNIQNFVFRALCFQSDKVSLFCASRFAIAACCKNGPDTGLKQRDVLEARFALPHVWVTNWESNMKRSGLTAASLAALALGATLAHAEDATMHGKDLRRVGSAIAMKNFDVLLDGRLLTASDAIYNPDTGEVELKGTVKLKFGKDARTFPGEVK
jgi:hypothetical protein